MSRSGPESRVVKACATYLRIKGHLVTRMQVGTTIITSQTHGRRAIRSGSPGWADLIGCTTEGRFLAVECKSKAGRQSELQAAFQREVEARGGLYVLARDVMDLMDRGL